MQSAASHGVVLNEAGTAGLWFRLRSRPYLLEVSFTPKVMCLRRNDKTVVAPYENEMLPITFYLTWAPNQISALALGAGIEQELDAVEGTSDYLEPINRRLRKVDTVTTFPPFELVQWARQQAIVPQVTYRDPGELYSTVVAAIQGIEDKVRSVGMVDLMWDVTREGNKVLERKPKNEPDTQDLIHALLFDIATAKNLNISPESETGGGNLDFLFTGTLSQGILHNVCVEIKHAHSKDLVHGLTVQLPAYMKSKGCRHGVYVVIDFRGPGFDAPTNLPRDGELDLYLREQAVTHGVSGEIRIVVLKLGRQEAPSRK